MFRPIDTMPADRRDGREMMIEHGARPWVRRARFWSGGDAWVDVATGGTLLGVTRWADAS
jgi:hypothetical protein